MGESDIRKGKGVGYKDRNGKLCMIRCFHCGKENYAAAVAGGTCAWCGYDANKKTVRTVKKAAKYGPSPIKGAIKLLILQDQLKMAQRDIQRKHGRMR